MADKIGLNGGWPPIGVLYTFGKPYIIPRPVPVGRIQPYASFEIILALRNLLIASYTNSELIMRYTSFPAGTLIFLNLEVSFNKSAIFSLYHKLR